MRSPMHVRTYPTTSAATTYREELRPLRTRARSDQAADLRGHGLWTLSGANDKVHVRFDRRVHADRALLRILTPLLRPLFRWNHNVAIEQATVGLEPYARSKQHSSA